MSNQSQYTLGGITLKRLLAVILLAFAGAAFAGNDNANPCGNNGNNCTTGGAGGNATSSAKVENYNDVRSSNVNSNKNEQSQGQGQAQGQKQGQAQGQGQSQSTKNSNDAALGVSQNFAASPASPGGIAVTTTANCRTAGGASVGAGWGGVSLGGSVRDFICSKIDLAKAYAALGSRDKGLALLDAAAADLAREEAPIVPMAFESSVQ